MIVRRSLPLLSSLLLGACALLPKPEQPDVYLLPSVPVPSLAHSNAPLPWSLRIATPLASASLDSSRIAVVPGNHVISVYHGARWADPAPALWRNRLLDAFRGDGRLRALSSDEENLQSDYVLGGQLRAFQSEYQGGKPVIVIAYDAWLADSDGQHVIASRRFELHQSSQGTQITQVVDAFGIASSQLASQLIDWTVATLPHATTIKSGQARSPANVSAAPRN